MYSWNDFINDFPYTNFNDINVSWFLNKFKQIFDEWEGLYNQMLSWKEATDTYNATWREQQEQAFNTWQTNFQNAIDVWKFQTQNDIGTWENTVLENLNTWKNAFITQYNELKAEVEQIAEEAETAKNAAQASATSAANSAENASATALALQASLKQINTNTNDISELKTQLNEFYYDSELTATGELFADNVERVLGLDFNGSATSAEIRNAQIFEANFPSIANSFGVDITRNDDGSYTFNGVATSGAWYHLNKTTRTGINNPFALSGTYSLRAEIISGSIEKNTASSDTLFFASVIEAGTYSAIIGTNYTEGTPYNDLSTGAVNTSNTIVTFRMTTGAKYNNLRIRFMLNKGEPKPWVKYQEPTTINAPFSTAVDVANEYKPSIWVSVNDNATTITLTDGKDPKYHITEIEADISEINTKQNETDATDKAIVSSFGVFPHSGDILPNGKFYGYKSVEFVATKTNHSWVEDSHVRLRFDASKHDYFQIGCFERNSPSTGDVAAIYWYDSNGDMIMQTSNPSNPLITHIGRAGVFFNTNGGYISNFIAPVNNAAEAEVVFFGITSGGATVIGETYYQHLVFAYVGNMNIVDTNHIPQTWLDAVESISSDIGTQFSFGIESDTHYYIGKDANVAYDLNQYAKLLGLDFIGNLGDIVRGYADDVVLSSMENTRKSYTDIVKRYVNNTPCPVLFALGNHDSNYEVATAESVDEISKTELFGRYLKFGLRTMPDAVYETGKFYYYKDFNDVRVIMLNTGDGGASANTFDIGAEQISWFENVALDTNKAVLVLSHVPLVPGFTANYGTGYASIVSALEDFKRNGGYVIACICGHMHEQDYKEVNTILYITCNQCRSNYKTAEIFMCDMTNNIITTKAFGESVDRTFTINTNLPS